MTEVENLLDESIAPEGYLIQIPPDSYDMHQVDLSQIDFEQLSEQFQTEHKRVEAERLKRRNQWQTRRDDSPQQKSDGLSTEI